MIERPAVGEGAVIAIAVDQFNAQEFCPSGSVIALQLDALRATFLTGTYVTRKTPFSSRVWRPALKVLYRAWQSPAADSVVAFVVPVITRSFCNSCTFRHTRIATSGNVEQATGDAKHCSIARYFSVSDRWHKWQFVFHTRRRRRDETDALMFGIAHDPGHR